MYLMVTPLFFPLFNENLFFVKAFVVFFHDKGYLYRLNQRMEFMKLITIVLSLLVLVFSDLSARMNESTFKIWEKAYEGRWEGEVKDYVSSDDRYDEDIILKQFLVGYMCYKAGDYDDNPLWLYVNMDRFIEREMRKRKNPTVEK